MKHFNDTSGSTLDIITSLKNIRATSENFLLGRPQRKSTPSSGSYITAIPSLTLPLPQDIDHVFSDFILSSQLLDRLSSKYRLSLQELQRIHHQKFEQTCQELYQLSHAKSSRPLPLVLEDLRKVFESSYVDRYLPMLKNEVHTICSSYLPLKKTPFNVGSTPLLEKYFEYNAYPSAPDRKALAVKTKMIPRQIEVWFQNHRKRAKESGRKIRKIAPNLSYSLLSSLDKLASSNMSPGQLTYLQPDSPLSSESEDDFDNRTTGSITTSSPALDFVAPSYAFPTCFSPSNVPYHFHIDTSFAFPPPVWMRSPSSTPVSHSAIKINELTAMFAEKLNLWDASSKRATSRKDIRHKYDSSPWFFATTTILSRAPHAAFIRTPKTSTSRKTATNIFAGHNISPSASVPYQQSFSLPSAPFTKYTPRCKKSSPFPKRAPTQPQPLPRVWSDSDRSTSTASTSSDSRLSSSSSSIVSSSDSSMPSSPESLPHSDHELVIINEDMQFLDDIFNDTFYNFPPPLQCSQIPFIHDSAHKETPDMTESLHHLDVAIFPNNYIPILS